MTTAIPGNDGINAAQSCAGDATPGSHNRNSVRHAILDPGTFLDVYDRILGDVDVRHTLRQAAEVAVEVLHAERASVFRLLPETHELQTVVTIGNVARAIRVPVNAGSLAGFCALAASPLVVDDAYGDLRTIDPRLKFDRSWDEINGFVTRSVLCVPVMFQNRLLGVAQVINSRRGTFNDTDLKTLSDISRFIGYALHYAGLYEELATLKKLDKEKAEFMRIMVHELKSPVATSKTMAETIMLSTGEDTPAAQMLRRINARMDELLELIGDIMELSRIKSGSPMGRIAVHDLGAEVSTQARKYAEHAEAKGLSMSVRVPREPVPLLIDGKGIQLVVSNLMSNAIKYTAAGSVDVSLDVEAGHAVLKVTDTGIGIPKADLPRLFREFFRASNARKQKIQGTGVGLAGIRDIVERYNGVIEISSDEGKGSCFVVSLPVSAAPLQTAEISAPPVTCTPSPSDCGN